MKKISIVIPAHNEENRIGKTLEHYTAYFDALRQKNELDAEFVVVNNASSDRTAHVVKDAAVRFGNIKLINLGQSGKGLAITTGFHDAVTRDNDYIGFVDADMATQPQYFHDLITNVGGHDGIIASRYMPGAEVYPPRPWIKYWGRKLIYDNMVRLMFGLPYHDFQCGAKLFTKKAIEKVAPQCTIRQWAFDVELLYLCKKNGFTVKEIPTVWHDQAESKLRIMGPGTRMLGSIIKLRLLHSRLRGLVSTKDL